MDLDSLSHMNYVMIEKVPLLPAASAGGDWVQRDMTCLVPKGCHAVSPV